MIIAAQPYIRIYFELIIFVSPKKYLIDKIANY
jgi:hypothetical protein